MLVTRNFFLTNSLEVLCGPLHTNNALQSFLTAIPPQSWEHILQLTRALPPAMTIRMYIKKKGVHSILLMSHK
jgi:hypothetical protein